MDEVLRRRERLRRLYDRQAWLYDATRWLGLPGRRRILLDLAPQPGERILDLGCGTGTALARIADRVGPEGLALGVDQSPRMLARARQRTAHRPAAALRELSWPAPLDEAPFDAVHAAYSLSLFDDARRDLTAALTLLRPGGRVAVLDFARCTPPFRPLFRAHGVRIDPGFSTWLAGQLSGRVLWERRALGGLWTAFGFVGLKA